MLIFHRILSQLLYCHTYFPQNSFTIIILPHLFSTEFFHNYYIATLIFHRTLSQLLYCHAYFPQNSFTIIILPHLFSTEFFHNYYIATLIFHRTLSQLLYCHADFPQNSFTIFILPCLVSVEFFHNFYIANIQICHGITSSSLFTIRRDSWECLSPSQRCCPRKSLLMSVHNLNLNRG